MNSIQSNPSPSQPKPPRNQVTPITLTVNGRPALPVDTMSDVQAFTKGLNELGASAAQLNKVSSQLKKLELTKADPFALVDLGEGRFLGVLETHYKSGEIPPGGYKEAIHTFMIDTTTGTVNEVNEHKVERDRNGGATHLGLPSGTLVPSEDKDEIQWLSIPISLRGSNSGGDHWLQYKNPSKK